MRDGHVRPGDAVAVYGLGAIGQIAAQICKRLGASPVIVIDPIAHRREIAVKTGLTMRWIPDRRMWDSD